MSTPRPDPPPGDERGGPTRRHGGARLLAAALAMLLVAGVLAGVLVALKGSPPSALTGMSPAQMLARALSAARQAGSVRVVWTDKTSASTSTLTVEVDASGGSLTVTQPGAPALHCIVLGARTYVQSEAAGLYEALDGDHDVGAWLEVASSTSIVRSLAAPALPGALVAGVVALNGSISRFGSGPVTGPTVSLLGTLPSNDITAGGGAGALATLTISTSPPYYPQRLTATDDEGGSDVIEFSDWGERFEISAPSGAVAIKAPTAAESSDDTAVQANLDAALTAVKTYFVGHHESYTGLTAASFDAIGTGLQAEAGTVASTGVTDISLLAAATYVVMTAWAPTTARCWAVLDDTAGTPVDGSGAGTRYVLSASSPESACRAATYAVPATVAGSRSSLAGFPSVGG